MAFRLRDRAGRLTAVLLSALVLQLTAVTHLHVVHGVDRGAAVATGDTAVVSHDSDADDHSPACPLCLLRAQSYSFAPTQRAAVLHSDGSQHPKSTAAAIPVFDPGRDPAAPRGPPASFT